MPKFRFIQRLKRYWFANRKNWLAGFTLIELLVSLLIGGIITAALLSLVIDLTDANQKDTARSETQRDMQLAMNYIVQDLREAVYVYSGTCLTTGNGLPTATEYAARCPGLVNYIAPQAPYTPVLAFWRPDPLPDSVMTECRTAAGSTLNPATGDNDALRALAQPPREVPCASGKSYTLVVYGIANRAPGDTWQGRARIARYQLRQFQQDGTSVPGWSNPLFDEKSGFQQWPFRSDGTLPATRPTNTTDIDVLVDFVDDTPVQTGNQSPTCPPPSVPTSSNLVLESFLGCVQGNTLATPTQTANSDVQQEVQITLTGNVAGRSGFPIDTPTNAARLSPLQTRVLVRGALKKTPS